MTSLLGGITTMLRILLLGRFRVERDGVPTPNVSVASSLFEESLSLFAAAWDEGRAMTLEQAVAYALEEVDRA